MLTDRLTGYCPLNQSKLRWKGACMVRGFLQWNIYYSRFLFSLFHALLSREVLFWYFNAEKWIKLIRTTDTTKIQFRLHKSVTKPEQLQQFFKEWNGYLAHIEQTGRERQLKSAGLTDAGNRGKSNNNNVNFGRDAPAHIELNEEQQSQLQKLREEATNAKKTTWWRLNAKIFELNWSEKISQGICLNLGTEKKFCMCSFQKACQTKGASNSIDTTIMVY